jgi:hypothetical protein
MVIRLRERGYCAPRCLHLREPAAQPALMRAVLRYQTNSYPPRPSLASSPRASNGSRYGEQTATPPCEA